MTSRSGCAEPNRPGRHRAPRPSTLPGLLLRVGGLAIGVAAAFLLLPIFLVPPGPPPLPLTVDATVVRSGTVAPLTGGQLLSSAQVRPGSAGQAHGSTALRSETSVPVDVAVDDIGAPIGLEDQLWLRVTLGDTVVFQGEPSRLRTEPSASVRVRPGAVVPIAIAVGLSPGTPDSWEGRRVEVRLRVVSTRVDAGRGASTRG